MRRVKLDDDGCSVNFNHIVTVERKDDNQIARLVSGDIVGLVDIYPLVHDLFKLSKDVWVNPEHVSAIGIGYNKSAAYKDAMNDVDRPVDYYKQIEVQTVLGRNYSVWPDIYTLDELDYLAELLDQEN